MSAEEEFDAVASWPGAATHEPAGFRGALCGEGRRCGTALVLLGGGWYQQLTPRTASLGLGRTGLRSPVATLGRYKLCRVSLVARFENTHTRRPSFGVCGLFVVVFFFISPTTSRKSGRFTHVVIAALAAE